MTNHMRCARACLMQAGCRSLVHGLALLAPALAMAADLQVEAAQLQTLGVELGTPTSAASAAATSVPATVVLPPSAESVVSSVHGGVVVVLARSSGDAVTAGEVLASVRSPALLGHARHLREAEAALQLARAEHERDRRLLDAGVIAEKRMQSSTARLAEARAAADEQRGLLRLAGLDAAAIARLASAHDPTPDIPVTAPRSGVIVERYVGVGDRIEPLAPIYRIASLELLWLEARVPVERITEVTPGARVAVEGGAVEATVIRIGQIVDADTQTVAVRAELPPGTQGLRPGQFVHAMLGRRDGVSLKLPAAAVVRIAGQPRVFVRVSDGFDMRAVEITAQDAQAVTLGGGLAGDEQVAVAGTAALKALALGMGGDE